MSLRLLALMSSCAVLFSACTARGFDVVKDGRPNATVVIPAKADRLVKTAADDFVYHVRLITGATLPVIGDDQPVPAGNRVLIGDSRLTREMGISVDPLPREGFRIVSNANTLAIVGKDKPLIYYLPDGKVRAVNEDPLLLYVQTATWFGVTHYLEKYHGVRWLWPGEDGIAFQPSPDFAAAAAEETNAPTVIHREMYCLWQGTWILKGFPVDIFREMNYSDADVKKMVEEYQFWQRRVRLGVGGSIKASHADSPFVAQYRKTHPEFLAQNVDGTRPSPDDPPDESQKLCVSNPEVAKAQVERGRAFFASRGQTNVEEITFNVGFNDGDGWCWCDQCKALDPPEQVQRRYPVRWKEGGVMKEKVITYPFLSDRYVTYWNRIAEGLAKDYPDKLVGGMIYGAVGPPPIRTRVNPNIIVPTTSASNLRQRNPIEAVKRSLDGWFKMGLRNFYWRPNLMYFDYFGLPFYHAEDSGELLRYMLKSGGKGFEFDTCFANFATDGVNVYVLMQMMWDAERTPAALVREYCDRAYGKAGTDAYEYMMRCKAIRQEICAAKGLPERDQDWIGTLGRFFNEAALADLDGIAKRMDAASRDDSAQYRKRVAVFLTGHKYTLLQAGAMALNDRQNKTADDINRLAALVAEKERFIEKLGPTWAISGPLTRFRTRVLTYGPSVGYLYYGTLAGKKVIMALPDRWSFYLDQPDAGESKKVHTEQFDDSRLPTLSVNGIWESQGVDYNGIAWYRTRFRAPAREEGKRYALWFGAVDESCWVYLNGQKVGENIYDFAKNPNSWLEPFSFDVTDLLRFGEENLVAVKVRDISGAGGIYKGVFLIETGAK